MTGNKIIFHVLRVLIGLIFIVSAILKLISADLFELYIFSLGWFDFNISAILARMIISGELLLGVMLLTGFYFKRTRNITFFILILFSAFLVIRLFGDHSKENCNCFGELIKMTPAESLIKNLVLLILLFAIRKHDAVYHKYRNYALIFASAFALSLPFIFSPPDAFVNWNTPEVNFEKTSALIQSNSDLQKLNVAEGKKIVCFFSVTCTYCELASKKISVIAEKNNLQQETVYVFTGDENHLDLFWEKGGSEKYLYTFLPVRKFFDIAGPVVPSVFLTENGNIIRQYNYRNIDEKEIKDFFERE